MAIREYQNWRRDDDAVDNERDVSCFMGSEHHVNRLLNKRREGFKNIKSLCIHKNLQIRLGDDKVEKPARKQIEVYQ